MSKVENASILLLDHERSIVFEADSTNEDDLEFRDHLEAAAALNPKNLQELFMSIANQNNPLGKVTKIAITN